jgi:hypothetical protein
MFNFRPAVTNNFQLDDMLTVRHDTLVYQHQLDTFLLVYLLGVNAST